MKSRPRLRRALFIVEHVTWSQIVRLLVLARGLDPSEWEVHFASASFDERLFGSSGTGRFKRWPIHSIDPAKVEKAIASGSRIYEPSLLARYVEEERRLIDAVRPDVVVSDLRWSTAISAPVSRVPCVTLINAFWSAHAVRERFPLPDHPIVKLLGVEMAEKYFPMAIPKVFAHFAKPVNDLRRKHGLSELGSLQEMIVWGDRTLFPDDPALVPLAKVLPTQQFLGPILWSPDAPLPEGFDTLGRTRPLVYATLGSSGSLDTVPTVLEGLGGLDADVVFSTARRTMPKRVPANVRVVEVAPGDKLARRASVVVCNGGASTAYQALAEGTPVVGIPQNLDAWLAMSAIRDAGAGIALRAGTLDVAAVRAAVTRTMREDSFRERAQFFQKSFAQLDPHARFRAVLDDLTLPKSQDLLSATA